MGEETIGVGAIYIGVDYAEIKSDITTVQVLEINGEPDSAWGGLSQSMSFTIKSTKQLRRALRRLYNPDNRVKEIFSRYTKHHPLKGKDIMRKLTKRPI